MSDGKVPLVEMDFETLAHLCLERHKPELGGCVCGFCNYSVEHVMVSFARELEQFWPLIERLIARAEIMRERLGLEENSQDRQLVNEFDAALAAYQAGRNGK